MKHTKKSQSRQGRLAIILMTVAMVSFLLICTGCDKVVKEAVEVKYGETITIDQTVFKAEELTWTSADTDIATVENGTVTGNAPGETVITVKNGEKVVGEYTVTVTTIAVKNIVLSTNTIELYVDAQYQLAYTLFPENATDYGLSWKSANDKIATVDEKGMIEAKEIGQTTISISNVDGFIATCAVTVIEKPAYDRLSLAEKAFVDMTLKHMDSFYNADSVVIKAVQVNGDSGWRVDVSAQNGLGGYRTVGYFLSESLGFWNWAILDIDMDVDVTHDASYDLTLINAAIKEKRA